MREDQDELFAEIAIERGWLSPAQVREARHALRRLGEVGLARRIWQVCLDKGFLGPDRVEILKRALVRERGVPVRLAGYEILERLGQGGMGQVFLARRSGGEGLAAIKLLSAGLSKDREFVRRFEREARLASRLEHPNLVRAFEFNSDGKRHFIAMEFVEGGTVAQAVEREGPMPPERVAALGVQAAKGLGYAHEQGVVHRDVKPSNLLLAPGAAVKVADMGIAREGAPQGGDSRSSAWTPAYAAPEQLRANVSSPRSDIFSLGATLFFMLTGEPPFSGATAYDVMVQHHSAAVPSAFERRKGANAGLDAVLKKMMAKRPEDRYRSMEEAAQDLESVCRGGRPQALLDSPEALGKARDAKRRVALLVAATGSLLLGLGLIAFESRQRMATATTVPHVLHGELWDAATDLPLAGARVVCVRTGREAVADAQGAFRIVCPPAPRHDLRLLSEGRLPALITVEAEGPAVWVGSLALGAPKPVSAVRRSGFRLRPGGAIEIKRTGEGYVLAERPPDAPLEGPSNEVLKYLSRDPLAGTVAISAPFGVAYAGASRLSHFWEAPPDGYSVRLDGLREGDVFFFRTEGELYGKAQLLHAAGEGVFALLCVLQAAGGRRFPPGPGGLRAEWDGSAVRLEWAEVPGASRHTVWRRAAGGEWERVARTRGTGYIDRDVEEGAAYLYAVNAQGESIGATDASETAVLAANPGK